MSAVPLLHLAIALVAAHVWVDFGAGGASPPQEARGARRAARHAILYGILSGLLLPAWSLCALGVVVGLALVRGALYAWRARGFWPYARLSPLAGLALDQAARLAAIAAALAVLFPVGSASVWLLWHWVHEALGARPDAVLVPGALTLAAAYVWAVPGGSTIVRAVLEPYAAALPDEEELSLGRVIGHLERLILLTLFLLDQYAAIGLIITAKSVIRIPSIRPPGGADASTAGTGRAQAAGSTWAHEKITAEYFLIGTLASIAVALFAGLLARWTLTSL